MKEEGLDVNRLPNKITCELDSHGMKTYATLIMCAEECLKEVGIQVRQAVRCIEKLQQRIDRDYVKGKKHYYYKEKDGQ